MKNLNKKMHLICNAHLDPVWQWEWEEGAAEALSTFRIAAKFCEEYDGFVFNHNEALLYKWIEEYEPKLFDKITKLIKEGKWHIMGGWYLQPDCNMPSGEAFVRQIMEGRHYFKEKFNVVPTSAINFDPFGHTRGLVQIMAKMGYDSYIFCRPNNDDCPLEGETFNWIGYDGSSIIGQRFGWYNSSLGESIKKIDLFVKECPENDFGLCLWGVGNHGGGPSKKDLDDIAKYQEEMKESGINVIHSTPEKYFIDVKKSSKKLPDHKGDLNSFAVGCYTSQIRIKQKYRELENKYFMTEKMCSSASSQDLMKYPNQELKDVLYDMLTTQFHDTLPGSSVQPVEEMAIRTIDHGLEILSRIKARAFFALSNGQKQPLPDEIPILVYNPHPYTIEGDFECELMLWDQNRNIEFSMPVVYNDGVKIPSQPEKELSNIPIDWRKRVVFHAKLLPMSMNRFDCKFHIIPEKPVPNLLSDESAYIFESDLLKIRINKNTGLIDRYCVNGVEYLKEGAFSLNIINDNYDPWGMTVNSFKDKIGEFTLLSDIEGRLFSGIDSIIPSVRVIENGDVRCVVEAVFGYNSSRAVVKYKIPKHGEKVDIEIRVLWNEKQKMLKMFIPSLINESECLGQVAYGVESLPVSGKENVSQKYLILKNKNHAISVINDGIYGSSCEQDTLKLTLLRSPVYTAHPVDDRKVLPQDRYNPHIDQGERIFNFQFSAGDSITVMGEAARSADVFNEKPMALSLFPSGEGEHTETAIELDGDNEIIMTAFKKSEDNSGYIIRLFNSCEVVRNTRLISHILNVDNMYTLKPFEILSLKLTKDYVEIYNLMEKTTNK